MTFISAKHTKQRVTRVEVSTFSSFGMGISFLALVAINLNVSEIYEAIV